ncbi:response regulator transcription factor [Streptomyces sp. MP131-18]|uniref:response regulator transcription factor n=1 Tax=Streptomyces sp. MP131-18 TaxID=1857892 RepID=UPI00097BAF6F|nr:response regulator transcription factor [Streptomyces sp. MP131-18]ONK09335.1 Transcriptional regulatory protein LiaR [Streptomyces sp. MP131-18]
MPVIRVLLAGENKLLQEAVFQLLAAHQDMHVLGAVAGEAEMLRRAAELRPHVILLEPWPPPLAAVRVIRALRARVPRAALLVLATRGVNRGHLLAAGAHRCLPAGAGQAALLSAVRELSPAPEPSRHQGVTLSPRQQEVLALAAEALSNKQIARSLDISIGTVKRHLHVVFRKLGAVSRLDAVSKAASVGLLPRHVPSALGGAQN